MNCISVVVLLGLISADGMGGRAAPIEDVSVKKLSVKRGIEAKTYDDVS